MIPHDKLTIFRNRQRAKDLRRFRQLVELYYDRSEYDEDELLMDWEGAREARSDINRMMPRIIQIMEAAGLDGSFGAANSFGPGAGGVNIIKNIFSARYTDGAHQEVLDAIDMALGVYEANRFSALARTFNPFYYVGVLLGLVASLPIRLFRSLTLFAPRRNRVKPADLKQLEAAAARLASAEEMIEKRFADLKDWQSRQFADNTDQLTDLAERMDFAERVLAQKRDASPLQLPKEEGVSTPV